MSEDNELEQKIAAGEQKPEEFEAPETDRTELKETNLQISDEQLDHLQKQMDAELKIRNEQHANAGFYHIIKKDFVNPIYGPEIKRELAKGLLAALKASKTQSKDEYMMTAIELAGVLRNNPKNEEIGAALVAQNAFNAAATFSEMNENGRQEIELYLEGMMEERVGQSLEQYLKEKYSLESNANWNPEDMADSRDKEVMTTLAMMNANNLEDFTIKVPKGQEKNNDEIQSNIKSYYESNGYEVEDELDELMIKKDGEKMLVTMSNYGENIMISICPM